jgi:hypothetical protein
MKFHLPSFLIGVGSATLARALAPRLRPVVVELGAVWLQMLQLSRGLLERQRETGEDLWAEVQHRAKERAKGLSARAAKRAATPASQPS